MLSSSGHFSFTFPFSAFFSAPFLIIFLSLSFPVYFVDFAVPRFLLSTSSSINSFYSHFRSLSSDFTFLALVFHQFSFPVFYNVYFPFNSTFLFSSLYHFFLPLFLYIFRILKFPTLSFFPLLHQFFSSISLVSCLFPFNSSILFSLSSLCLESGSSTLQTDQEKQRERGRERGIIANFSTLPRVCLFLFLLLPSPSPPPHSLVFPHLLHHTSRPPNRLKQMDEGKVSIPAFSQSSCPRFLSFLHPFPSLRTNPFLYLSQPNNSNKFSFFYLLISFFH